MERLKHVCCKMILLTAYAGVLLLGGCEPKDGWPWARNMYDSPGPQYQDGALEYPENTLPVEGGELAALPGEEEEYVVPDRPASRAGSAEEGEALFNQFCSVCHGLDATGKEMTDDFFTPDLTEQDYVDDYPDEDIYLLIVDGGINMPGYREEIAPRERWLVIDHLRRLQSNHGQ